MFFKLFVCFVFYLFISSQALPKTRKEAFDSDPNNIRLRAQRSLEPEIVSLRYNEKVVALELDDKCLNSQNISNPNMILTNILNQYPCLSCKQSDIGNKFYSHGNIHRTYLNVSSNATCLQSKSINWNTYCIHNITYDVVLKLNNVQCASSYINQIVYDNNNKPYAWHLDAIDQNRDYIYNAPSIGNSDGNDHGIDIWILDSGVNSNHNEFIHDQIIKENLDFIPTLVHGTATASCASGRNYGTSKGFNIHDYPVCHSEDGCSFSDIDEGLHKVIDHMKNNNRRSVINLSLGSAGALLQSYWGVYYDHLFDDVLNNGGIVVVSAGNDNTDACNYWFSYSDKVISVGAHDNLNKRSSFSNYGPCVDIYAPGTNIPVAGSATDNNAVIYMSGTSFSGPLIAGLVANLLYEDNTRTKDEIVSLLQSTVYPISDCPSGFCFAARYSCHNNIESSNIDPISISPTNQPTQQPTKKPTRSPTNVPTLNPTTTTITTIPPSGCCRSHFTTTRLSRYCKSLSLNECTQGRNGDYCFVDNTVTDC